MRIINANELFTRLCKTEYELLKYINRTQGAESRALDYNELSAELNADKRALYSACKRLVDCSALIAEGENFRINEEIYKQ